jgi:hypothetical protein
MAILTPKLTLNSSDISTSEQLNLTLTDALTVDGPVQTKRLAIDSSSSDVDTDNLIFAATDYTKAYVLLYNTSTASSGEIISIGTQDTDSQASLDYVDMLLAPGEWAFYPWSSTVNLIADASSGSPILEARIYQSAS